MHQPRKIHWIAALMVLAISKALLEKICCTRNLDMFIFLTILT